MQFSFSKEKYIVDISEWINNEMNSLEVDEEDPTQVSGAEDRRSGRIGNTAVYFTLDRSFGVIAINQEGLNVISACRFATIAASCAVYSGRWMYEFQLGSKGIMQIGWCSNKCVFTADRGCGDTTHSYAFDGSRIQAWNMAAITYGERWRNGDIIASCLDLDNRTVSFRRNGHDLGVAFSDLSVGSGVAYMPCLSLVESESICANFGAKPFRYPVADFEPLQQSPKGKILQSDRLFTWLKNACSLSGTKITGIQEASPGSDLPDRKLWTRLQASICYHINGVMSSRYCIFSHFVPFIKSIENPLRKQVLDALWLYIRDRYMDKAIQHVLHQLYNDYRQVSEDVECREKHDMLQTLKVFLHHERTRKHIIGSYLFERMDILPFLTQAPLDEPYMERLAGDSWWDTEGIVPEIEKRKPKFLKALHQIEKSYEGIENVQIDLMRTIMCNTDGGENEPSSRGLFLKKFRKFCWHELDCARNEFSSKTQALVAYGAFLRLFRLLNELWAEEVGNHIPILVPPIYFFDRTFLYNHCDRVGGLEPFLANVMHDQLLNRLGPQHRLFAPINTSAESGNYSIHLEEIRGNSTGFQGIVEILDGNTDSATNTGNISISAQPLLQALFMPLLQDRQAEALPGNMEPRLSLIELFEDLVIFFTSTIARHCRKV